MTQHPDPWTDILAFWFAPGMEKRWFAKDPAFDDMVRTRLGKAFDAAAHGEHDSWLDDPNGGLALCILLDQTPRNLFRDTPRAYATDSAALRVARHLIDSDKHRALTQKERLFVYLPLEHAEDLALQEECLVLTQALDENPEWYAYALRHRDIIARFGRFPHRNATLGRPSTAEEQAFLREKNSSF